MLDLWSDKMMLGIIILPYVMSQLYKLCFWQVKVYQIPDKVHQIPDKVHQIPDKVHQIPDRINKIKFYQLLFNKFNKYYYICLDFSINYGYCK